MADVAAIRNGLKTRLDAITGWQVSAYLLDNPTPPCAMIYAGDTEFDKAAARGSDACPMVVRVIVPNTSDIGGQMFLDELRAGSGPKSVKAAIEGDTTLGGAAQALRVTGISQDTLWRGLQGQILGIGCEFQIALIASGTV